ncbi:MAG: enoyl-CoA hydratase/isomerase family protein [Pseudomonadales bacterium]|nr:enoyl-CoA hydratase/isomerase family protein [Pseudomonadales bacterium]
MSDLIYEKKDGVAILTMNRPKRRNSFSPEMMVKMAEAWVDFGKDDSLRVAILTGTGDISFSSGADLQLLIPLLIGAREPETEWDKKLVENRKIMNDALLRNTDLYKPIISAVNGYALAGGTEILQATDIRVASPNATFGLSEPKRGIVPGGGSLTRLQRQIPFAKAMEILLIGDPISAEEAHRIGLINEVVPQEALMDKALEIAGKIAENGPLAVRKIKEALIRSNGLPLEEAFKIESECAMDAMKSEDAIEGPKAFMEKRKPNFTGKLRATK